MIRIIDLIKFRRNKSAGEGDESEPPREVFLDACEKIAGNFSAEGFTYYRSHPGFSKKDNYFKYSVFFSTSHDNVANRLVKLSYIVNVRSPWLMKWRKANNSPYVLDDRLAAAQHFHLLPGAPVGWNLAGKDRRLGNINDITARIRESALPFFRHFESPKALLVKLTNEHILGIDDVCNNVELALSFGERKIAQILLDRYCADWPELVPEVEPAMTRFVENGYPKHVPSTFADAVACLRLGYDLK